MTSKKRLQEIFIHNSAGRILLGSLTAFALYCLALGGLALVQPELAKSLVMTFFAHLLGGRAAGVAICLSAGIAPLGVIAYNMLIELIIVFIAYALFVLTYNHTLDFRFIRVVERHIEAQAHRHEKKIEHFGWFGLFLFVMLPLPIAGPLMGIVIGFLLRFSVTQNFSAVLGGTLGALVIWTYFFKTIEEYLYIVRYVVIFIILSVVVVGLFDLKKWLKEERK
ncbi:MAG: hypothetical protein A2293_16610 [Elusimicrobia bacterium RIFOXYB2_FULL_49_7]|nr:MAG: hypothetical protein A2293_16610 [Elusimicrobia bacterium RIFOXYB2_FULL_49_7]